MAASETPKAMRPCLHPDQLYIGDNGRVFCGTLACAGSTAYYTGHDLSGQRIDKVPQGFLAQLACETCTHTRRTS